MCKKNILAYWGDVQLALTLKTGNEMPKFELFVNTGIDSIKPRTSGKPEMTFIEHNLK